MDVYMLSNPLFCRARFITVNYRKEIDFRKMAASLFYFYTEIGGSISKTCWLEQSLLCYVPMATGKIKLLFSSQSLYACTSKSIKISQYPCF